VRNTNRVLQDMSQYLSSFRHYNGENVYYLNKEGRERVNSQKVCKKSNQIEHYLMRNDLYITLGRPVNWRNEIRIKVEEISVIADAHFEDLRGTVNVIEVDNTQKMSENKKKVEKYREIVKLTGRKFKFHWITTTHYRQKQLIDINQGLDISVTLAQDYN
jgi:hypothetical protein